MCKIENKGGETVVYKKLTGDYRQIGAVIEIYDIPNKKILYRKEIGEKYSTNTQRATINTLEIRQ